MVFAQFYSIDLANNISEAVGSESVLVLDGRWSFEKQLNSALQYASKRKNYIAVRLYRGDSFSRSHPISALYNI